MIVLLDWLSKSEKLTQQLMEFLMGEHDSNAKVIANIVTISLLVVQNNTTIIFIIKHHSVYINRCSKYSRSSVDTFKGVIFNQVKLPILAIGWLLVLYVTVILESIMNLIIECDLTTHMIWHPSHTLLKHYQFED